MDYPKVEKAFKKFDPKKEKPKLGIIEVSWNTFTSHEGEVSQEVKEIVVKLRLRYPERKFTILFLFFPINKTGKLFVGYQVENDDPTEVIQTFQSMDDIKKEEPEVFRLLEEAGF